MVKGSSTGRGDGACLAEADSCKMSQLKLSHSMCCCGVCPQKDATVSNGKDGRLEALLAPPANPVDPAFLLFSKHSEKVLGTVRSSFCYRGLSPLARKSLALEGPKSRVCPSGLIVKAHWSSLHRRQNPNPITISVTFHGDRKLLLPTQGYQYSLQMAIRNKKKRGVS